MLHEGYVIADRYRVLKRLKRGGMGSVYEVIDGQTDRRRALKVLSAALVDDPRSRERFRSEAMVTGRVESDHVVEVTDAGFDEAQGCPYLVMELLRGEDLAERVARCGALSPSEVVELLAQTARGLDRVHDEDIVHRDLKPNNIFVHRRDDGGSHVKILDFGIAKTLATQATPQTTQAVGTPLFMAPEQLDGDALIDGRADLYSLAHIAYVLLTGKPFLSPELERSNNLYEFIVMMRETSWPSASRRAQTDGVTLPASFDDWFQKATALAPQERFDSAATMVTALALVFGLEGPAFESFPRPLDADLTPSTPARPAPRARRSKLLLFVPLVLAALAWHQRSLTTAPPQVHAQWAQLLAEAALTPALPPEIAPAAQAPLVAETPPSAETSPTAGPATTRALAPDKAPSAPKPAPSARPASKRRPAAATALSSAPVDPLDEL